MVTELSRRTILVAVLILTSLIAPVSASQTFTQPAAGQNVAGRKKHPSTEKFVRTELFFGSDREDGPDVTDDQFRDFLKDIVTPEFPDGLTVLTGRGQFCCNSAGEIIQETSFVLILLYPIDTIKESSAKIEKIRDSYKESFKQQSVLRVDDPRPVRVSF